LECSRQDIQATRLLHERQIFPLSVYHLQQAVEKATKAYALSFNAINKEDLVRISHKSPITFIKMLEKKWVDNFIVLIRIFHSDAETNISEAKSIINLRKTQKELANLTEPGIQKYLDLDDKIRDALTNSSTRSLIDSQVGNIVYSLKDLLPAENIEKSLMSFKTTFNFDIVCSFGSLYILSVVTYPHWEFTRYPDKEMMPCDYSSDLGIVQCVDKILIRVENALEILNKTKWLNVGEPDSQ